MQLSSLLQPPHRFVVIAYFCAFCHVFSPWNAHGSQEVSSSLNATAFANAVRYDTYIRILSAGYVFTYIALRNKAPVNTPI